MNRFTLSIASFTRRSSQFHTVSARYERSYRTHPSHHLIADYLTFYEVKFRTADGLVFVKVSEILYCEAASNYTEIVLLDNRKYIVSRTLKEYEDMLAEQNFYRIHHSYLINLNEIKKYVRGEGGYVIMNNDKSLDVSKRKKEGFLSRIGAKI
jgi:two-component system LytT family response regulator